MCPIVQVLLFFSLKQRSPPYIKRVVAAQGLSWTRFIFYKWIIIRKENRDGKEKQSTLYLRSLCFYHYLRGQLPTCIVLYYQWNLCREQDHTICGNQRNSITTVYPNRNPSIAVCSEKKITSPDNLQLKSLAESNCWV